MIKPLFILILLFIISVFKSGIRPAIQNFNVMTGTDGKSLQLSWKYTEKGDYWCVIPLRGWKGSDDL